LKKNSLISLLKVLFFLGIGFFSIWWFLHILSSEEKKEILNAFSRAQYQWLAASMAVGLIAHYIRALRWNMLILPLGYKPKIKDTFAAVAIGYIGNFIIPRFGEIARCYSLRKTSDVPFTAAFGTVIVERIIDMLIFMILFIVGLYFFLSQLTDYAGGFLSKFLMGFSSEKIWILVLIAATGCVILCLLYLFRKTLTTKKGIGKLYKLFAKFKDGLLSLTRIKHWPLFIFYTLLIWVCYISMTWLCFLAIEETAALSIKAAFASVTFGTVGIIVVQGGIGVYPAIVSEVLSLFGTPVPVGYAMGWLTWMSQTVLLILMGLWAIAYLFFIKGIKLNEIRKNPEENTESK
jgi:glycosyltransferase 2 family protein